MKVARRLGSKCARKTGFNTPCTVQACDRVAPGAAQEGKAATYQRS